MGTNHDPAADGGAGDQSAFPFTEERSFKASYLNTAVFVARGSSPGPAPCLTAGIHGDELIGVEVARKAFSLADPAQLRGTLIALPAINMEGVRTGLRSRRAVGVRTGRD